MITMKYAALLAGAFLTAMPGLPAPAWAQAEKERAAGFGNFGSSKEPIKIDADRLDVFDKEGRAVFTGNVVAVQGDSTMNCTLMTVFYEQNREGAGGSIVPTSQGTDDSSIKKIDCKGPVTIVSKTQVATGNEATFDRQANKIYLTGNAALSDGPNVTRGERVVYDLNSGVANVEAKQGGGGRVRALFVPGSGSDPAAAQKPAPNQKPAPAPAKPQNNRQAPTR
ncbi:lipopolysaccharide transport periplasmic protein LptA [Microvirga pudoricolor]|uniref:lipopolysaccharide transport periplasmic protein LptA n=1 Tax=Microvirga pudoricolor TaxID=2778729 RepID=UPI00194EE78D|nr:lipopolysaccharide transport periplasmic protein LptA [Microvirga pudoricolor]MBM6594046.1 lipopolysaccharide transport periplasmic protein LptA [Microvirga pudoricolor]